MSRDPEPTGAEADLRLTITLPGSASLGALQAGAMAALAEALDELVERGTRVHLDAIGGASAGSIVALLFTRGALLGADVAELLRRSWVEQVDVEQLRAERADAPLGTSRLHDALTEALEDAEGSRRPLVDSVGLYVGLSNLLGLRYPVASFGSTADALTFADWATFELDATAGVDQFVEPRGRSVLDYCLASASHPGAFAPRLVDRSADRAGYVANSVTNYPDSGSFWFTDGGLVESKPVGRVLELGRRRAGDAAGRRMHLVVDPRSSGPSGDHTWCSPDEPVRWVDGLRRAVSIVPTQALHDDLREVAANNERIDRVERLARTLAPHLDDDAVESLRRASGRDHDTTEPDDAGEGAIDVLSQALMHAAGIDGMERIDVEMISPLEIADGRRDGVSDLLAGDFIGAFGGFLDRELRSSDFALGWCSVRSWLPGGLGRHGVPHDHIQAIDDRLAAHRFDIDPDDLGEGGISSLSFGDRVRLGRLAGRVARILVAEGLGTPGRGRAGGTEESSA